MKGWEALKALEEGKKVKCHVVDGYFYLVDRVLYNHNGIYGNSTLDSSWLIDENWEIYEEPEEEIKPCVYCKSKDLKYEIFIGAVSHQNYACMNCGAKGPQITSDEVSDAVKKWNTRA